MKKKLMSLICGAFMMVFSLFSLSGCGLVSTDTTQLNKQTVMTVNGTKLSKSDIYSSFYTYYQNNSTYFSYYDSKTIEESFYTWTIIKEVIDQKAKEALYDAETNPTGFIYYTKDDAETVWKNVQEYFYLQVSTKEKAIYSQNGYEESKYPIWIRAEEEETADSMFEAYETAKPEAVDPDRVNNLAEKLTESEVKSKLQELTQNYLFEYVVEEANEEENKAEVRAPIDETNYISGARNQAYADYINDLRNSAKASGKKVSEKKLLEDELVRIYEAYYNSQITTIFQKCYLEEKLVASDLMSDKAIVKAYLDQYFTDLQVYQAESSYITTMTSSDGATLVLYNFNGQNYFFSVQHILIKYDDNMTTELSKMEGYSSSSSTDYDEIIHQAFLAQREEFTNARVNAMLTEVKDTYNLEGVHIEGNYYHYDEEFKNDASKNYGYIKVLTTEVEKDGEISTIYYVDADDNGIYSEDIDTVTYTEDQVVFMATKGDVLKSYQNACDKWIGNADSDGVIVSYFNSTDDAEKQAKRDAYKNMAYLFDVADEMKANGATVEELKQKTASLLFVELQWIYSSDSLANEFSNKVGYIMSNYEDENGSWVVDFAVGARDILASIQNGDTSVLGESNVITSNYGYHIIKIENIYTSGASLVDMTDMLSNVDLENEEYVAEMVKRLKSTYVSTSSNQTVYDYFYDKLYTGYAGSSTDSSSSGTYFLDLEYEWLVELYDENKITYQNKIGYDDLMDYLNN